MLGWTSKESRLVDRRGRKHQREFIRAGILIERDEVCLVVRVSRERKIQAAADFVTLYSRRAARLSGKKNRGCITRTRPDHIEISILVRRKVKPEMLARLHGNSFARADRIGRIRCLHLQ